MNSFKKIAGIWALILSFFTAQTQKLHPILTLPMGHQQVCQLGDMTGFKYLAEGLRQNYKAQYLIQSSSKMSALNTSEVLEEIKDLGYRS